MQNGNKPLTQDILAELLRKRLENPPSNAEDEKIVINDRINAEIKAYKDNLAFKINLGRLKLQEALIEFFSQENDFDAKTKYKKLNDIEDLLNMSNKHLSHRLLQIRQV